MIVSDVGDQERRQGCELQWTLQALLVKTAQQSLGDGDGKFGSTMIFHGVWLILRTKLCSF